MGFDVIAVESSMSGCDQAGRMAGTAPAYEVEKRCLMWQWHTPEVGTLFSYLEATRKTASPLTLAGFDTQLTWPTGLATGAALRPLPPAALGGQLAGHDAQLGNDKRLTADAARGLLAFYTRAMAALAGSTGPEIEFQRQALHSRMLYVRQLASSDFTAGSALRKAEMHTIGLYMGRGVHADNFGNWN